MRQRALRQHSRLAQAVIAGDASRAAREAATHFSLTKDMLADMRARLRHRYGGAADVRGTAR